MKVLLSGNEADLKNCSVEFSLLDADRRSIWQQEAEVTGKEAVAKMELSRPHLWDGINDPYLYTGVVVLKKMERKSIVGRNR